MRDLKAISFSSFSLSSLIGFRPRFANSDFAGASNTLLAIILTALFCSFWCLFMSVVLQNPQTEEQYLKCGSTRLLYMFFKIFYGRNCFACFNTPMARETFLEIFPRAFSKLDAYQSENQDFLFP